MNIKTSSKAFALTAILVSTSSLAENHSHHDHSNHNHHNHSPSDYGPIGVMNDHLHEQGNLMLSYRYSRMLMKGLKDGDSDITPAEIISPTGGGYMATPTRMTMDMHMIGAMYGVTSDFTLMAMGMYSEKRMDMLNRMGGTPKMRSQGFGDTTISGLYKLNENLHFNLGVSLPTGSTDEKGFRMGAYGNLPYAMQLGSGTYDPAFGATYFTKLSDFTVGLQGSAKVRTGKNDEGYRLGDEFKATSWISKDLNENLSASIRLEATSKDDTNGADQATFGMRNMVPTFDPQNYGGERINLGLGINFYEQTSKYANHRLGFEYKLPIYENLNGPQMSLQHSITLGWQVNW